MESNNLPAWFLNEWNDFKTEVRLWMKMHQDNHHGRHGRRYLNRANAQGLLVVGLIAERILSVVG